jgi:predicted esterase
VFITGSDVDEWVPLSRVRDTADVLTDLGAEVRRRLYSGRPHLVSEREIGEARNFLEQVACTTQNV